VTDLPGANLHDPDTKEYFVTGEPEGRAPRMGRIERTPPGFKINKPLSKDRGLFILKQVRVTRGELRGKHPFQKLFTTESQRAQSFTLLTAPVA